MKKGAKCPGSRLTRLVELGEHIVADPEICHGKPTFKGTRIMVWQILDELAHGMTPDEIVEAWGGRVTRASIAESVQVARRSLLADPSEVVREALREFRAKDDPAEVDSRELAELLLPAVRGPHRVLTDKHFDTLRGRARGKPARR